MRAMYWFTIAIAVLVIRSIFVSDDPMSRRPDHFKAAMLLCLAMGIGCSIAYIWREHPSMVARVVLIVLVIAAGAGAGVLMLEGWPGY